MVRLLMMDRLLRSCALLASMLSRSLVLWLWLWANLKTLLFLLFQLPSLRLWLRLNLNLRQNLKLWLRQCSLRAERHHGDICSCDGLRSLGLSALLLLSPLLPQLLRPLWLLLKLPLRLLLLASLAFALLLFRLLLLRLLRQGTRLFRLRSLLTPALWLSLALRLRLLLLCHSHVALI